MPLTERSGRGVVLTSAGHALARSAADVADRPRTRHRPVGRVPQPPERRGHARHVPHGRRDAAARACSPTSPRSPASWCARPTSTPSSPSSPTSPPTSTSCSRTPCRACCPGAAAACKAVPLLTEPLDIGLPADHRLAGRVAPDARRPRRRDLARRAARLPVRAHPARDRAAGRASGRRSASASATCASSRRSSRPASASRSCRGSPRAPCPIRHRAEAAARRGVRPADRGPGAAGCRGAPRRAHGARRARGARLAAGAGARRRLSGPLRRDHSNRTGPRSSRRPACDTGVSPSGEVDSTSMSDDAILFDERRGRARPPHPQPPETG